MKRTLLSLFFVLLPGAGIVVPLLAQSEGRVISSELRVEFDGRQLKETHSYEIQIDSPEGVWMGDVHIPFKEDNRVKIHEALICDTHGEVLRKLKKKEIVNHHDLSASTFHQDNMVSEFQLKWDRYPYRIRYSYSRSYTQYLDLVNWDPYPSFGIPVDKALLELKIPEDLAYRIRGGKDYERRTIREDGNIIDQFTIGNLPPLEKEDLAPDWRECVPRIVITPEHFYYGVDGSAANWTGFGNWFLDLNYRSDRIPEWEMIKLEELLTGVEDEREKVRILYHYMQDRIRYVNVSLDVGGLKSYPASYVSQNAYGDCKALTTYMKALLNAAGIDSRYCLVHAGSTRARIDIGNPGARFNHVILAVPMATDTIWLENTSTTLPFNYLGTFTQDRWALLVDRDRSALIRTPALEVEDVLRTYHYRVRVSALSYSEVDFSLRARGAIFEDIRYYKRNADTKQKSEYFRKLPGIHDLELGSYELHSGNRDERQILVELQGSANSLSKKVGEKVIISPRLRYLQGLSESGERNYPIRISYPVNRVDSMEYQISNPERWEMTLPGKVEISSEFGSYSYESTLEGGHILTREHLLIQSGDFPASSYGDFYKFIKNIKTIQRLSPIVLKPKK